ncbi:MAG: spermidine/putrescine ABC transporter substrate-binding protein [Verrucomicrobia bacterium]|nr:spermidine/putrescine ABC transporter substrate-binding protein [Verrucomicrobiota bacterium]
MKRVRVADCVLRIGLPAIVLALLLGCGGGDDGKRLNVYIWTNYITQELLSQFTAQTGIKVRFDVYDSNEAVLEKLASGASDYDIVVPTDYMVRILAKQGLLTPLDHAKLTNLSNITPRFRDLPFDKGNFHSVPYLWGTTGFAYNKAKVGAAPDSWAAVFDERRKGRVLMLDDMRECFSVALRVLGHSANSTNATELAAARDLLIKQKPLVKTYNSSDFAGILRSGDVWIAHGYNGELAKACDEEKNLAYVIPKEGCTVWVDNLCIPKSARHVEAAHAFINYMLEGKNIAAVVNAMSYACANDAARPFIKPALLADPARYPDEATLKRCDFLGDLGESLQLRDRYWTEVKAK